MQHDFLHDSGGRVGTIDVDDTAVLDKVLPKVELCGLELVVELGFFVVFKLELAAIDVEAPVVSDVGTVGPRLDPDDTGGLSVVLMILLVVVWVCAEEYTVLSEEVIGGPGVSGCSVLVILVIEEVVVFVCSDEVDSFGVVEVLPKVVWLWVVFGGPDDFV